MGSSSSRPADSVADSVSPTHSVLTGRVALVSGPTNGIGYETARVLAKHGAHVILAARDTKRAEECKVKFTNEIKAEIPSANPQFTVLQLDLSSLASIRHAAHEFLATGMPLHILVNNAGIFHINGTYAATADGFESHVGTNYLGHYYLTRLLLPKLRSTATKSAPTRIVNVSSALHNPTLKSPDDIEKSFVNARDNYSDIQSYNRSKLYNIYHAQTLAVAESGNHVLAFAVHPGVVDTHLSHKSNMFVRGVLTVAAVIALKTPNSGASTTIHCALRADQEDSGKYFANNAVAVPKSIASKDEFRATLVEVSEKLVNEFEMKHETGEDAAKKPTADALPRL